jgi:hypothetical protein
MPHHAPPLSWPHPILATRSTDRHDPTPINATEYRVPNSSHCCVRGGFELCHDRESYHWQLASDNVAEPSQKRDGRQKAARRNAPFTLHVKTLDHLTICEVS